VAAIRKSSREATSSADFRWDRVWSEQHERSAAVGTNGGQNAAGADSMVRRRSTACSDTPPYRSRGFGRVHYGPARPRPRRDYEGTLCFAALPPTRLAPREGRSRSRSARRSGDVRGRAAPTRTKPQEPERRKTRLGWCAGVGRMLGLWLRLCGKPVLARRTSILRKTAYYSMQWFRGISIWAVDAVAPIDRARRPAEEIVWARWSRER